MYNKGVNKEVLTLVVLASLLQITSTAVYHVIPDNSSQVSSYYTSTLQYYLDNDDEYFKSHTQLYFSPGQYYLRNNFILQNVSDFTMHGNRSILICTSSSLGITISNVQSIKITNIELKQCGKVYEEHADLNKYGMDNMAFNWRGALYLNHSTSVIIHNVSITINAGVSGMIVINSKAKFIVVNFSVLAVCEQLDSTTSGMIFYNDDYNTEKVNYDATNISYKTEGLCNNSIAIVLLMAQEKYNTTFNVYNTLFSHLRNSSVIYYYGKSCGTDGTNVVKLQNCKMEYNRGNFHLNMFHISIHSEDYIFLHVNDKDTKKCNRKNIINFRKCNFVNNSNMNSLIHVTHKNSIILKTIVDIRDSHIDNNHNVTFIESNNQVKAFWQLSLTINIMSTNISFNTDGGLASLMSLKNVLLKFMHNVIIKQNKYKTAIIQLHFSVLKFINYTEFSDNRGRHILQSYEGSYYLLEEGAQVSIINNTVYTVLYNTLSFNDNLEEICWFQFISKRGNLDKEVTDGIELPFKILLKNNKYIIPPFQLTYLTSRNCSWLTDTAFQNTPSCIVYGKIVTSTGKRASKKEMKDIPSKLCYCLNISKYDCTRRELGEVFPGQTLKAQFIMDASIPSNHADVTIKIKNDKLPTAGGCIITNALQMVQTGPSHICTTYNYTIRYAGNRTKCELYLITEDMPEIFNITIKPCPVGFSLHSETKICDCDEVLMDILSITSCNLNDRTILRPTNSWLSANTVNHSHTYRVTISCPFDYCLPHSSQLDLTNPDTQCQFSRSGELCAKCKKGLSTVFGSSRCKKCSNIFVLIIVPIAIAGFLLVAMLFVFNLTVANGKINTIIFYANIININYLVFFPKHNSPLYVFLSLLNLDLGIETCFYDGMDDYAKSWLQLLFPIYLLMIAGLLIKVSRYSVRIQRITARKVLPVLATLFLLSYTKIIRTISSVFCYSKIIHLPSESITLAWSVCTSIPLFGVKFIALFTVCIILLLIMLPFNVILLFSRKLTYFKFVNHLKPLLDTYHGPYKDKVSYWVGLQLFIRKVILGLSVFNKDVNFLSASILFGVMFCIHGVVNPFNSRFQNIQEALILLNLLAIHITVFFNSKDDGTENMNAVNFLILIAAIYFIIVFFYQCLMMVANKQSRKISKVILSFKNVLKWEKLKVFKRESSNTKEPSTPMELSTTVPDVTYDYKDFQEPLLALSD